MSKSYKIIIILLASIIFSKAVLGQRLIVERAESNVLVKQDNLVKAKKEALKDAKTQVILQAVSRFLDYESMINLQPILKKHFLKNLDFFIESIRVTSEGSNDDLSEFNIKIETQIFRSRILSIFRKLSLPKLEENIPIREIFVIYNINKALRDKKVFAKFFKNLQIRLLPYRIRAKLIDTKDKYLPIEIGLPSRLDYIPNKKTKNNNGESHILLELKLELTTKTKKIDKGKLEAKFIFWKQNLDILNSQIDKVVAEAKINYTKWDNNKIIPNILDKLMLKWTPVIKKIIEINKGYEENINLKFVGIPGPIEEQILFKTLFQNNQQWKEIFLNKFSKNTVSYKGIFLGNKNQILKNFNRYQNLQFNISSSFWKENKLVIKTKWRKSYANLEKYKNSLEEHNLIENSPLDEKIVDPIFQVPLKTFKETYILPLGSAVLDNIRHRGDSTLFKINLPKNKSSNKNKMYLKIFWHRIGKTNLSPRITLFDHKKNQINSFLPGRKKQIMFKQEIKQFGETFFLRISDELGFLEDVSGSYQFFRYILTIRHS